MEKIGEKDGGSIDGQVVVKGSLEAAKAELLNVGTDTRSGDAVREEVTLRASLEALDLEMGLVGSPTNTGTQRASAGQDHYLGGKFRGLMARLGIGKKSEEQGRRRSKSIDPKKADKGAKTSADDMLDAYQVSPKSTVVLIICNKNFANDPKHERRRNGSDKDLEDMTKAFTDAGYEIFVRKDLTARGMLDEIDSMRDILVQRKNTSLFIC